jgi:hypothetical protein
MDLAAIDEKLRAFALEVKGQFSDSVGEQLTDDHQVRSVKWDAEGLNNLVQIYPSFDNDAVEDRISGWNFWICSSKDENDKRYWKTDLLIANGAKSDIIQQIDQLLAAARTFFKSTGSDDLEFAGQIEH